MVRDPIDDTTGVCNIAANASVPAGPERRRIAQRRGRAGRPRRRNTITAQTWNSEGYAENARFVTDLGAPVLALLAPRPGEHILDLGCGDGVLTKIIADRGCKVVGVDSSSAFVASAKTLGLEVIEKDASDLDFDGTRAAAGRTLRCGNGRPWLREDYSVGIDR